MTTRELLTPAEERLTAKDLVLKIADELELDSGDVRFLMSCLRLNKTAEFIESICFYAKALEAVRWQFRFKQQEDEECKIACLEMNQDEKTI